MAKWNSEQYLKFKAQRTQPCKDLISRLDMSDASSILDIGCGPGNSTAELRRKNQNAYILGIDSSDDMILKAKQLYNDVDFMLCDASSSLDSLQKFDIVFSNACLQWIPDHMEFIPKMFSKLNKNGVMAVQIPLNFDEPIHKIISEVAQLPKYRKKLSIQLRVFYTLKPEEYYDILSELTNEFDIWKTVYHHQMKSHSDIMEWYKGTGLRPYLQAFDCDEDRAAFEADVYSMVEKAYPLQKNGDIIFRFPRLFFTAKKC